MSLTVSDFSERPVELLRQLIRYDTTNPPGNEEECIRFVQSLLAQAGIDATLLTKVSGRPNLIARLPGEGHAPPLLLCGHVDVVTAANQNWTHPPFEARVTDGYVWGRGALDMKGGVTMMLSAFLRAREENLRPSGDVILALLSDEEAGGENGRPIPRGEASGGLQGGPSRHRRVRRIPALRRQEQVLRHSDRREGGLLAQGHHQGNRGARFSARTRRCDGQAGASAEAAE